LQKFKGARQMSEEKEINKIVRQAIVNMGSRNPFINALHSYIWDNLPDENYLNKKEKRK
jgi:hypothetical protein